MSEQSFEKGIEKGIHPGFDQGIDVNAHTLGSARVARHTGFRDPNEIAAREVSIKLLREILEYQQQLNQLLEQTAPASPNLVNAYRRAIRIRREMLRDLPDQSPHEAPDRAIV